MPTIAGRGSPLAGGLHIAYNPGEVQSTPLKRRLRSDSAQGSPMSSTPSRNSCSPHAKWKSPRRCINDSPISPENGIERGSNDKPVESRNLLAKRLSDCLIDAKPIWNPRDVEQLSAVKEALHVSTAPSAVVCREEEQKSVLEFCKQCIEQEKSGSLYICGCPGTGKSLSIGKVKEALGDWAKEAGFQLPDWLAINCTSLTNASEIFSKILGRNQLRKKMDRTTMPLQHLQNLYSQNHLSGRKMMIIIADELDYLIAKDRTVLHDLFMLTTFPFAKCILIGIANAIDLADRFLPKLQSLNCNPLVITFRAYSKDQIITILQQRLMALPYIAFQPQALELCARRVAAASGDMRRALCICGSAIEILEAELGELTCNLTVSGGFSDQHAAIECNISYKQENNIVRVDHMAVALSKAYRSPVVETIQSLPQHQQIVLCSAVKLFRRGKKDTTVGELNKSYLDICKSTLIPAVGMMELSNMCRVLGDQGLMKLGQSRDDKSRRIALKVDEADITIALQGVRFFRNCLQ